MSRLPLLLAALLLTHGVLAAETPPAMRDKTLVAWVYPANLTQRGGSVLTVDDLHGHFDGIVFGERAPSRWMAGSDGFRRSGKDPATPPAETAGPTQRVQVAIVYAGNHVTLYRDGAVYSQHDVTEPATFPIDSAIVIGLRHLEANDHACFAGAIEDARVYDTALNAAQVAALKPGEASDPKLLAWWCFADGRAADRTGSFRSVELVGDARIEGGKLWLAGKDSYLVARRQSSGDAGRPVSPLIDTSDAMKLVAASRAMREKLLADPHRPRYHFVVPEGIAMPFDPNGAIFWNGRYHLFYIFQDERGHCWGHAASTDLLHWTHYPTPLAPNPGDPDRGMFSGNAFVSLDGTAVILYHGVKLGNCIATSRDPELRTWAKSPTNPIVPIPKPGEPGHGKYQSWDPHGWVEGGQYYAIFGGRPATLFKSADMVKWEFLHPFIKLEGELGPEKVYDDEDISCPDFFQLGDKRVLVCISHLRGCRYYVGRFENETFIPESHHRMNWPGGTCFAPETMLDGKGRRLLWAWALDRRPGPVIHASGYSGEMTLPRVLTMGPDHTLRIDPPDELKSLRLNSRARQDVELTADAEQVLEDVRGDCLELAIDFAPTTAAQQFGFAVRRSPDAAEQTVVVYDRQAKVLRVELAKSSLDAGIEHRTFCMVAKVNPSVQVQEAPLELADGEPLRLRVFLDRSILEVFANGRQCLTQRIYPTRPDSLGVSLISRGGAAKVTSIQAWDMAATND